MSPRARVVIADDHPDDLQMASAMLARAFEVVASVPDGAAAIEASRRLQPDVVVLDVAMPRLDGFQTAARIRAARPDTRIVFLSSYIGDDYVLVGLSRGGSAFVSKLWMERDLIAAVGHVQAGRAFIPSAGVLPRWLRPQGRRHDLQIYTSEARLLDGIAALFESAFRAGDSLLAVATEAHLQQLDARIASWGADVVALGASGRYTRVDAVLALDAVVAKGVFDSARFTALFDPIVARAAAAAIGALPNVTAFGEMAPTLCGRGQIEAMLNLERTVTEFASTRPLSVLCAYSKESLADERGDRLAAVCAEHCAIIPADPRS